MMNDIRVKSGPNNILWLKTFLITILGRYSKRRVSATHTISTHVFYRNPQSNAFKYHRIGSK